ncbi:MAG: MBL fold metallo-hydrolase [Patescibacteria group bacterium]|nr:MBL fold metallo-hydrolase [Patescibacteria group bacterium]
MEITFLGHSSFKLKDKSVTVVTDPFDPNFTGLKFPKTAADIVTVSHGHQDHNFIEAVEGGPFVVNGPGEYEIKGVFIKGVCAFHDNKNGAERGKVTLYNILIDGINVAHLGDLGVNLTTDELESLGNVDILLVPVGGEYTINAHAAAKIISEIEPKMVVPMHYGVEGLKFELEPVSSFLKEMGKENIEFQPKLVISKDKLPEELQIVLLEKV